MIATMELEIIKGNNPTLRKICEPITEFDSAYLHALVSNMVETMFSQDGAGLAAPQVAENIRLFVMRLEDGKTTLTVINPVITRSHGSATEFEGCLSIPGFVGKVKRAESVKATFQNIDGTPNFIELTGFSARVFQHETDHLDGILYPDKAKSMHKLKERV